jgi:peptidoglycan/LPS O-acetylase OafA/YrhL
VLLSSTLNNFVEIINPIKKLTTTSATNSTQQKESGNTILVLDGLRAIATLMVISFHIQQKDFLWDKWNQEWLSAIWTFGGSGVTLFFVLSGFLLFLPYSKALLLRTAWPSLKQFYMRRALRILPAYYIALVLIILLFQRQYLDPRLWNQLLLFITLFMDSTPETFRALNGPFWTLAIEWQFYMLLPLIALGFLFCINRLANSPQRRLIAVLVCCLLLVAWGLFIRRVGLHYQRNPMPSPILKVVLFFLYGTGGKYLENFAVGMAISACYAFGRHSEHGSAFLAWMKRISIPVGIAGVLLFFFTAAWHFYMLELKTPLFIHFVHLVNYFEWLNEMVIALAYGSIMFALLFGYQVIKRPLEWRPLGQIGLISYGLYMWHLPWIQFFQIHIQPMLPMLNKYLMYGAYWTWVVLLVVPIAILSYRFIEKPAIQLSHRKPRVAEVKSEPASDQQASVAAHID